MLHALLLWMALASPGQTCVAEPGQAATEPPCAGYLIFLRRASEPGADDESPLAKSGERASAEAPADIPGAFFPQLRPFNEPLRQGDSAANQRFDQAPASYISRTAYQEGETGAGPAEVVGNPASKESLSRALPSPWSSPPFPTSQYQGYPLIGIPVDTTQWPLMKMLQGSWIGNGLNDQRIRLYGWVTASGNLSTSKNSNMPDSYWIVPNSVQMDQWIFRAERLVDTVQTDHLDWGFRSTILYGIDYRYMTAGGWFSDQLFVHNALYGWDPTEQYFDLYIPWIGQGSILRIGRWVACPDIEVQFAPDNYLGSHSLLFTFDTYTQTGIMLSTRLNKQWMVQGAIESGTDMAPWYQGAIPTGFFGLRWVSESNNDSFYTCLNNINNAKFRRFNFEGQPFGHDNFNYVVSTWQHRINQYIHTLTEGYFMWQKDAVVGGTPSIGPIKPYGGGGGIGADIPGYSLNYGVLNYTMFQTTNQSYFTIRNEWWADPQGERTGFRSVYSSHTVGWSHFFSPTVLFRPEIGLYRSWTVPAFDLGTKRNQLMAGFDITYRF